MVTSNDLKRVRPWAIAVLTVMTLTVGAVLLRGSVAAVAEDGHDHAGEAHAEEDGHDPAAEVHAEEDGHDHGEEAHDDHEDHEEEPIALSAEERERFGIEVAEARSGQLATTRGFPGETRINEDHMAHIVPRASGIVRSVEVTVGDAVRAGDTLAWVESAELGGAKVDYLSKWAELGCCEIDLERAEEVHRNTLAFVEVLRGGPSLETLRKMNGRAMGAHRSRLVSAYADVVFAREAHQREKSLFDQEIGSREDFLSAERALKAADAAYAAAMDEAAFEVERALLEARSTRQVQEVGLLGAARRLHLLGLSQDAIDALPALVGQASSGGEEHACTDPNCTDCGAEHEAPEEAPAADRLGWYAVTAPFDGVVIDRHMTLGESVDAAGSVFTVADLDTVWVDIQVYQRDLAHVAAGDTVRLTRGGAVATGTVRFVSPLLDEATRTALARVELANVDGAWRPGLYVEARLDDVAETHAALVPRAAVQQMDGGEVVFKAMDGGFVPEPVVTGATDGDRVEVVAGLRPGEAYVTSGAFALKAHLATSNLSGHAGHGH